MNIAFHPNKTTDNKTMSYKYYIIKKNKHNLIPFMFFTYIQYNTYKK